MADRDDAPPREAMAHMMRMLPPLETGMAFAALRTLPDADLWRLIGWLADGLEPTREMVEAQPDSASTFAPTYKKAFLRAMLAAAKETRDE